MIAALAVVAACGRDGPTPPRGDPDVRVAARDEFPAVSPDGRFVAFDHLAGLRADGGPADTLAQGVYLLELATGALHLIARGVLAPAWSPDGTALYAQAAFGAGICRIDLSSGDTRTLTSAAYESYFPAPSPDGKRLALRTTEGSVSGLPYIGLMRSDGTARRRLTTPTDSTGEETLPTWSPAGDRVAYQVWTVRASRRRTIDIVVVDTAGSAPAWVATGESPTWHPRGEWIAFLKPDERYATRTALALVRADGSGERVLGAAAPHSRPAWTPDGAALFYTAYDGTAENLWRVDTDGANRTRVTTTGRRDVAR